MLSVNSSSVLFVNVAIPFYLNTIVILKSVVRFLIPYLIEAVMKGCKNFVAGALQEPILVNLKIIVWLHVTSEALCVTNYILCQQDSAFQVRVMRLIGKWVSVVRLAEFQASIPNCLLSQSDTIVCEADPQVVQLPLCLPESAALQWTSKSGIQITKHKS